MRTLTFVLAVVTCSSAFAQQNTLCSVASFTGEVKSGQAFHREIGENLTFRIEPENTDNRISGWRFEIGPTVPASNDSDMYVYPMTPPYRARNAQDLSTDYGTPAQEVVKYGHDFWFVLSRSDEKTASDALNRVLWPNTDVDFEEGLAVLANLPKGKGEFAILDSDVNPGEVASKTDNCEPGHCGEIRRIKFKVSFIVPSSFNVADGLKRVPVPCPNAWN